MKITREEIASLLVENINSNRLIDNLDLSNLDLSNLDFKGFNFININFEKTNLTNCNFSNANFMEVNLKDSILTESYLNNTLFYKCKMEGSYLNNLMEFEKTCFSRCDITNIKLDIIFDKDFKDFKEVTLIIQ